MMKNSVIQNINITERIIYLSLWGIAFSFFLMIVYLLFESWLILFISTLSLFIFLVILIAAVISLVRITKEICSSSESLENSKVQWKDLKD
jgi:hypothetical protein